ncbi:MAG: bifunctional UDP-N-acetylglucosamine diphosphorylase/glucosamine-1-phosphate N-acetyltransferase GlmU [Sphingomicrobium sp.]
MSAAQPPKFAAIILAAGQGTRMRSDTHKVLHPIAGKPMLLHLLDTLQSLSADPSVVVVGKGREQVEVMIAGRPGLASALQSEQKGTGHAVSMAKSALSGFAGPVLVAFADVPFISAATIAAMLDRLAAADDPGVVVLASEPHDTKAYGRVILEDGGDRIAKMVEHKDASAAERACRLVNSGMLVADAGDLFNWLGECSDDNAAGEIYLPDVVNVARAHGRHPVAVTGEEYETTGVNSRKELAHLEVEWQRRRRDQALDRGASLIDPESVWFSADTELGRDCTIEPHVVFGPGVKIADGATIHAFSHIEGAIIGAGASIGPFARIRPGTELAEGTKVGNFVELKKARVAAGAKVNHLSYIGDADIGAKANIGAGTITCNYDGFLKHRTIIEAGAFIGSNSALVAPVRIGAGAIVGAGSVITRDVAADSLAVARGDQRGLIGWAKRFRERMLSRKG